MTHHFANVFSSLSRQSFFQLSMFSSSWPIIAGLGSSWKQLLQFPKDVCVDMGGITIFLAQKGEM